MMLALAYGALVLATLATVVAVVYRLSERRDSNRLLRAADARPQKDVKLSLQIDEGTRLVAQIPEGDFDRAGFRAVGDFLGSLTDEDLDRATNRALLASPTRLSIEAPKLRRTALTVSASLDVVVIATIFMALLLTVVLRHDGSPVLLAWIIAACFVGLLVMIPILTWEARRARLEDGRKKVQIWVRRTEGG